MTTKPEPAAESTAVGPCWELPRGGETTTGGGVWDVAVVNLAAFGANSAR